MTKLADKLEIDDNNTAPAESVSAGKGAYSFFWAKLKGSGAVLKINLLVVLFCLPALAWYAVASIVMEGSYLIIPYSANIGIGLEAVTDAYAIGQYHRFVFEIRKWLIMTPLLTLTGVGLSGAFYVFKRHVCGDAPATVRGFFRGIKLHGLQFFICSIPVVVSLFALIFTANAFNIYTAVPLAVRILLIAISAIALLFFVIFALFMTTQSISYKVPLGKRMGNSLLFTFRLLPRSLVIFALVALPILPLVISVSILTTIFIAFYLLVGISFSVMIVTVYTQWAYDKFVNPKLREAQRRRNKEAKEEKNRLRREERLARAAETGGNG